MAGAALLPLVVLAGCGSSAPQSAAATKEVCQQVSAVLSDGPDPSADPVGYAEAQVLPLRQIRTPDRLLAQAIKRLASAYDRFYRDNGVGSSTKNEVAEANKAINVYCPDVAS